MPKNKNSKQKTSSTLSWSCSPAYSTLWKIFQVHLRRASRRAWHLLNQFWINIAERIAANSTRKFERTLSEEDLTYMNIWVNKYVYRYRYIVLEKPILRESDNWGMHFKRMTMHPAFPLQALSELDLRYPADGFIKRCLYYHMTAKTCFCKFN